jgi:replicative DNA helicase
MKRAAAPYTAAGSAMPPHSIEAEQALIGALLLSNTTYDRIIGSVCPADCFDAAHALILTTIFTLLEEGQVADIVTVFEALQRTSQADAVGGLAYLGEIASTTPSAANAPRYARIIHDHATRRALMAAAHEVIGIASAANGASIDARLAEAAECIATVVDGASGTLQDAVALPESLADALAAIDAARSATDATATASGLTALDARLHDLVPGALTIIAGRPGMGKSALALHIAQTVSANSQPGAVAFFTLEMPRRQLVFRLLSRATGIELPRLIAARDLAADELAAIHAARVRLATQPLIIDERGQLRASELRARCNAIRRKHGGLKLVVVDYLQLMQGAGENRTQEIGSISRALKAVAKDLAVPVIALSQLNRSLESRPNRRPQLADLRESGDIEQDADLIVFCYRDEVYHPDSAERGCAELIIAKQRNGPTGQARVAWLAPLAGFADLPADHHPARSTPTPRPRPRGFGQPTEVRHA